MIYWLPMTVAVAADSDFAATFKIGLLRVPGTAFGLVLTTILLPITPNEPLAPDFHRASVHPGQALR